MNPIALAIIIVGFPLSLLGFFLTRAYCRAKSELPQKPPRSSYRADLLKRTPTVIIG
jgi:hypothetical protein